jgi:Protein of unknown function (DUF2782)
MNRLLASIACALAWPCLAQDAAGQRAPIEPKVEVIVIEDDAMRIDELRVRGHAQRVTVTPKRGVAPAYQIITGDGSSSQAMGPNATRGAVGQRVWHMFSF